MQKITDNYALNVYLRTMGLEEDDGDCNTKAVMRAILTLTEREQAVLEYRYRLGYTLKKTGEVFGVGVERVRQIECKALRKLRNPSRFRDTSISHIIAARDYLSDRNAELQATIAEQSRTITEISRLLTKETREKIECYNDLQRIRNLVCKVADEIIEKIREHGYSD